MFLFISILEHTDAWLFARLYPGHILGVPWNKFLFTVQKWQELATV